MLRNRFSLKHLSMATGNFLTYCGLAGLRLFREVRYRISQKKYSENFIEYFTQSKNEMTKCVSSQIFFPRFWIPRCSKIRKIAVHSKSSIKIVGILLLLVSFLKSWIQSIIQIIRKNKSVFIFLINCNSSFTVYLKRS